MCSQVDANREGMAHIPRNLPMNIQIGLQMSRDRLGGVDYAS